MTDNNEQDTVNIESPTSPLPPTDIPQVVPPPPPTDENPLQGIFDNVLLQMARPTNNTTKKRTKRDEVSFNEQEDNDDSSQESSQDSSEEDYIEEEDEDPRWNAINKLLESHLNISKTVLMLVNEKTESVDDEE